jgi:uncharacterized membrane protein
VTALFHDRDRAAHALRRLQQQGFGQSELTVVSSVDREVHQDLSERSEQVDAHGGAWAGTALGAAVGGYLGLLSMVLIPALPLFIVGGAALGGIAGTMLGLGVGDHQAAQAEELLRSGGALVVVTTENSDRARAAKDLLGQQSARDLSVSHS